MLILSGIVAWVLFGLSTLLLPKDFIQIARNFFLLLPAVFQILLSLKNGGETDIFKLYAKFAVSCIFTFFVLVIFTILVIFLSFFVQFYLVNFTDVKTQMASLVQSNVASNELDTAANLYRWSCSNFNIFWDERQVFNLDIISQNKSGNFCLHFIDDFSNDPSYIFSSKCGRCGEFSYLYSELAKKANLSVRQITAPIIVPSDAANNNHNWNEVQINGKWIIVDTKDMGGFNPNLGCYTHCIKPNLTKVIGKYPNSSEIDLTDKYLNKENLNCSEYQLRYNVTCTFNSSCNYITN